MNLVAISIVSKRFFVLIVALSCFGLTSVWALAQDDSDAQRPDKNQIKPVLVHYMPWFSSRPVSGDWGWHWTMGMRDPDKVAKDDQVELASHYYPVLGPYDSADPELLDCHVALMKLSGINGVVIDWYGIEDHYDYATNHRNTILLTQAIKKAGLKFAICYEDQTIDHLVAGKKIAAGKEVAHGKEVLQWMEKNWFTDDAYQKIDGKPVLLVFGPQKFKQQDWRAIAADLKTKPVIFGLPHLAQHTDGNAFGWPPVSGGKETTKESWTSYLDELYRKSDQGASVVASVFPQYLDYYAQAGKRDSYGSLKSNGSDTFETTLDRAMQSSAKIVQIATWNDFGEGTMIEPTHEFGYLYLEKLQKLLQPKFKDSAAVKPADLRLPVELYLARKKAQKELNSDTKEIARLEPGFQQVSQLLLDGNCEQAKTELDKAVNLLSEILKAR